MKYNFHGRHGLPKLIQEEMDDLNSPLSITEFKFVVQKLLIKKIPGQVASLVNSTE